MKSKIKKIAISFLLTAVVYFAAESNLLFDLGVVSPHVGLLFVLGLLLGPYGAVGAVSANIMMDLLNGYTPVESLVSGFFSLGVSILAYKIWYSGFKTDRITKPRLDNIYHLTLFLANMFICGLIYSAVHGNLMGIIISQEFDEYVFVSYFLNFITVAFIFGIFGFELSKRFDFIEIPKKSEKPVNRKLYRILFILLMAVTVMTTVSMLIDPNSKVVMAELVVLGILLYAYLTKPFEYEIQENKENTVIEKIMQNFLIISLAIAIFGMGISIYSYSYITHINGINMYLLLMPLLIITDTILFLFFVPGIVILKYIENKVIKPISSFSKIEDFISENEKIESKGLVSIYSKYLDEKNEIGTLARSYTELINHNNNYIENIREIEGEKERFKAELDIATTIQASSLPTEAIESDDLLVDGYSNPAKEVGGDFFDYYMLDDENLAIIIGDASGKGVPAALIAMVTQAILKQTLNHNQNPSEILYLLNNQLCENNPESMFLTLWLGIYNRTSKKLRFSNAGHNAPLLKENGEFKYMDIDTGLVLGIMEDFKYVLEEIDLKDEIVLYTDGITDANNEEGKMYGEERLMNFFNGFESDGDPIAPLLDDINDFTKNAEQFDDMTLLYLNIK